MTTLVQQPQGNWAPLASETEDGAEVLLVTEVAPDTAILIAQPNGEWALLGVLTDNDGNLLLCVQPG